MVGAQHIFLYEESVSGAAVIVKLEYDRCCIDAVAVIFGLTCSLVSFRTCWPYSYFPPFFPCSIRVLGLKWKLIFLCLGAERI